MIETAYVVFCDNDDCEISTDDWHLNDYEARLYAQKHEGFRHVDGEDFCPDCFKLLPAEMQGRAVPAPTPAVS